VFGLGICLLYNGSWNVCDLPDGIFTAYIGNKMFQDLPYSNYTLYSLISLSSMHIACTFVC